MARGSRTAEIEEAYCDRRRSTRQLHRRCRHHGRPATAPSGRLSGQRDGLGPHPFDSAVCALTKQSLSDEPSIWEDEGLTMPKPNLFIIGTPRSGTTSLAKWLSGHPDVAMGPRKEPMFHASDLPSPLSVRDAETYLSLWDGAEAARMRLDASPWYLLSEGAAASIASMSPSARFVVSLRDPVEVIASLHAHHVFRGFEKIRNLEQAVFSTRGRHPGEFRRATNYLETVRLSGQIDRFLARFPMWSIAFVDFSRMDGDPEGVYLDLLEDLGLRQVRLPHYQHLNRARHNRVAGAERLFKGSRSRAGRATRTVISKVGVSRGRPPVDLMLRARIIDVLEPDIDELGEVTGFDLSSWKRVPPQSV